MMLTGKGLGLLAFLLSAEQYGLYSVEFQNPIPWSDAMTIIENKNR